MGGHEAGGPSGLVRRALVGAGTYGGRMAPRSYRWLVPLGVATVVAGGALAGTVTASADLPPRSPEEVLVLAQEADVEAFSGVVESRTELGLPDLAGLGLGAAGGGESGGDGVGADVVDLLTGDNTVRVWVDGPERLRAQLLEQAAETNVVRDADVMWVYRSADATALRVALPERPDEPADEPATDVARTPQDVADRVLAALDPTSELTAGTPVRVAGRDAYDLRVSPDDPRSLVGAVSLAVDAETGAVLRVRIEARGQDEPAVEVAWSTWSPERPALETFQFSPPPGTTVEDADATELFDEPSAPGHGVGEPPAGADGSGPSVVGEGWTAVVEVPADAVPAGTEALDALLTPVEGGAVLRTSLLSALRTDDGRWYVGAVTPETLQAVSSAR